MEARGHRLNSRNLSFAICLLLLGLTHSSLLAATYRTDNFIVHAPTPEFAKRVGEEAERFRKELAEMWAGQEMPNWSAPCPIHCRVGQIGAGGATTFNFQNGEVFGWNMNIQGSEERILDSVLPHEITHTILACIFRRPLPRWADEGMSTLIEHEVERRRQTLLLNDVMNSGRKIPLQNLLQMSEYPPNSQDVMKLYAQGYSLTDYLVQQGGRRRFLQFLQHAHRHGSWDHALRAHYGVDSVPQLEQKWGKWVIAGSPSLDLPDGQMLALNEQRLPGNGNETVVRGQTPDRVSPNSAPSPLPERKNELTLGTKPSEGNMPLADRPNQSPTPHQSARSRNNLIQPVFIQTVQRLQSETKFQPISRKRLKWTRDEFQTPKSPLKASATLHPFGESQQSRDLFVP